MIFPPSTEFLASLSGCHAKIPEASPFSILNIISLNTGRPGILAVCFSTKTSTTSICSFNAKSLNSASWSEILRTCLYFVVRRLASIDEKLFGLIIHRIVLANDEQRGAWKTLLESEFGGGNALVSRLRRDPG